MNKKTLIIGLAIGLISAIYGIVLEKQILCGTSMLLSYIPMLFTLAGVTTLILLLKKENGGYLTFKEGFLPGFIAGGISSVIGVLFSFINYNVLKSKEELDALIKLMADGMMQKGIPEAMALEMSAKAFNPLLMLVGLLGGLIGSAIISAIVAGILKKDAE